jgi:MarR family transcriptional regulator, organic hydroperoxide resistance regulator
VITTRPRPALLLLELQRATHVTLHALAARLAGYDLTASEINALAILADGQVRAVGQLAAEAGTKPTTLTSVLDRLSGRGYLTRELDPADRRSFLLRLTSDGERAGLACREAMAAIERDAVGSLPASELTGFATVVRALTEVSR